MVPIVSLRLYKVVPFSAVILVTDSPDDFLLKDQSMKHSLRWLLLLGTLMGALAVSGCDDECVDNKCPSPPSPSPGPSPSP